MQCLLLLVLLVSPVARVTSHLNPSHQHREIIQRIEHPDQDKYFAVFGNPDAFGKTTEHPNQDYLFGVFGDPEDFGKTTDPDVFPDVFGTPAPSTQPSITDPSWWKEVFTTKGPSTQRSIIETSTTNRNAIVDEDECLLADNRKGVCIFYNRCNRPGLTDGGGGQNVLDTGLNNICSKPQHVCCSKESIEVSPRETSGGEPDRNNLCGRANPQGVYFRRLDSVPTLFGEFPWMLGILRNEDKNEYSPWNRKTFIGGATLIGPRMALTAAHIVFVRLRDDEPMKVRAGSWNTQSFADTLPHVESAIVDASIHGEFNSGTFENNIAVLLLDTPLLATDHIGYACLPPQGMTPPVGAGCYFTKWGSKLEKASMDIVGAEECEADLRASGIYSSKYKLGKTLMGAGGNQNSATCKGMEGMPLICPFPDTDKQYVQHGIGIECSALLPALYVKVGLFRDWIDEQMKIAKQDTSTYSY